MKTSRLYQDTVLEVGTNILLDNYASHHLNKVLRFSNNQNIVLFNGDGYDYFAVIVQVKKNCEVKIHSKEKNTTKSKLKLTLAQGIAKGSKMEYIIQKAVELGVQKIVPIVTKRTVVKLSVDKALKRQQHWQKIAIAAAEQSSQATIVQVEKPIKLDSFLANKQDNGFILLHNAKQTLFDFEPVTKATILIGPEGGFSESECTQAVDMGYKSLLLSSRVLRTETASLAVIANMQLLWGS